MEKYFAPYNISLELKQLGFNEECLMYYDYSYKLVESGIYKCKAPLIQQVKEWLREKHNLHISIVKLTSKLWGFSIWNIKQNYFELERLEYETYEEAELDAIRQCIKIIRNE